MEQSKVLIDMRDCFREMADLIDNMLELDQKEKNGEDVKEESEKIVGKYYMAAMKLKRLEKFVG